MARAKRLVRWLLMPWWEWRLSRLSGIPFKVVRNMTEQEALDAFVGEPYGPPEEGTYSRKFEV